MEVWTGFFGIFGFFSEIMKLLGLADAFTYRIGAEQRDSGAGVDFAGFWQF